MPYSASQEQPFVPPPCVVLPQPKVYDSDASVAAVTGTLRQLGLGQASAVVCSSFPHNLPGAHYVQAKNLAPVARTHGAAGLPRPRPAPQRPLAALDLVKSPNLDVSLTLPARVIRATPGEQQVRDYTIMCLFVCVLSVCMYVFLSAPLLALLIVSFFCLSICLYHQTIYQVSNI